MPSSLGSHSRVFVFILAGAALAAGGLAVFFDNTSLGLAAAVLGLYVLHLYSMQEMQRQWRALQGLERLVGELGLGEISEEDLEPRPRRAEEGRAEADEEHGEDGRTVRRDFGLGTVAIIKGMMSPRDVSEVMSQQRDRPELTFGDHAVELGHLTETQLEDLVQVKHRGVYTPEEIREAREKIQSYRNSLDPEAVGA